ncbi:MAG: hypothetical protein AAFV45_13200 [Pseudomonadota bacterium]
MHRLTLGLAALLLGPFLGPVLGQLLGPLAGSSLSATARADTLTNDWADCRSGDYKRVITGCGSIIKRRPGVQSSIAEAAFLRGAARVSRGELFDALDDLDQAIAAKPNYAAAYLERGRVHETQERFALAKRDYQTAATFFDDDKPGGAAIFNGEATGADTSIALLPVPQLKQKANEGLERLEKLGGLIAEPETVTDFYNNARVFERRGDPLSARRMYERAATKGTSAIDLHQAYVALLKSQEGLLGAREIYADLGDAQPENKAVALMAAVLASTSQRETKLRALAEPAEGYGPAWYEIAQLYSVDRLGDQALSDKQKEKAALEAFVKADEAGDIYRHFLDKRRADALRDTVVARLAPYQNRAVDISPVTLSASPSNSGWMVTINLAEPAKDIRYAIGNAPLTSLGQMDVIDTRTGMKMPRMFFSMPLDIDAADIYVSYDDVRGNEQGPFRKRFNAAEAHVANAKNILENITPKWIEGRDWNGKYLVYFTHLLSYGCALSEIRYGEAADALDARWPVPGCNPKDPFAISENTKIYKTYRRPPASLAVQLIYADGSQSPVKSFSFP